MEMFGFLKKAIGSFMQKVSGKEEEKEQRREEPKPEAGEKRAAIEEQIVLEAEEEITIEEKPIPKIKELEEHEKAEEKNQVQESPKTQERKPFFEVREEKRELAPRVGLLKKITGVFTGSVTIGEGEVQPLFDDLRIALLESDVSLDTSEFLVSDLHSRLVGKQVSKGGVNDAVKQEVKNALLDLFKGSKQLDFEELIKRKKQSGEPAVILFIGPNGMGKTTTIAKLTKLLSDNGHSIVLSASDSFRSGAIQQLAIHGEKLGVRVVKRDYGADPTAVAFDAIAHAKAQKSDVVLIDTAGRQETNYNLIREMEKMNRVLKPDLRIFVGESIAGHALIEQLKKFNETVGGIDGVILTKLDADAKGGTAFSIAHDLKIPILFIGVGQEYSDLKPFNPEWLVNNVLS